MKELQSDKDSLLKLGLLVSFSLTLFLYLYSPPAILAQQTGGSPKASKSEKLSLVQAVICEDVMESNPKNQAIVFSISLGKVICFTSFDPVPAKTVIYHNWFFKDKAKSKVKLTLKSPKWKSISRIKLREQEKGPWRVEIRDSKGKILRTLRFSIVD
ncbi:DUF2914 domain-containing protein [Thermodesulfobacteriota bacterium]